MNTLSKKLMPLVFLVTICVSTCSAQVQAVRGRVAVPQLLKIKELVARELYFVKKVCNPSPEQFQTISDSAATKTTEMQAMYAEYGKTRKPDTWPRPEAVITRHLQQVVKETLSKTVSQTYTRELEARKNANDLATASLVANFIDSHVSMSAAEIENATEKLAELDTTKNAQTPVVYLYQHMLPLPPLENFPAILTPEQHTLWKLQSHTKYSGGWVNYFNSNNFLSVVHPPGTIIQPEVLEKFQIIEANKVMIVPARPAQARPAQARPAQAKPAQAKPAQAKPAQVKPAQAKPAQVKPAP